MVENAGCLLHSCVAPDLRTTAIRSVPFDSWPEAGKLDGVACRLVLHVQNPGW